MEYLRHWEWSVHKYTDKITKNGKTTYIYPDDSSAKKSGGSNILDEYQDKFNDIVVNLIDSGEDTRSFIENTISETGVKGISDKDLNTVVGIIDKMMNGGELSSGDYITAGSLKLKYGKKLDTIIDALAAKKITKESKIIENESPKLSSTSSTKPVSVKVEQTKQSDNKTTSVIYANEPKYMPTSRTYYDKMTTPADIIKDDIKRQVQDTVADVKNKATNFNDAVIKPSINKGKQFCNTVAEEASHIGENIVESGKSWLKEHKWW